jgi:broad specificity phosphatase PhoE
MPEEDPGDMSGDQYAWIEKRYKYLHHVKGEDELYDLASDPHETRNLLEEGATEHAQRLRAALEQRVAELRRHEVAPVAPELDPQTREELRALGYLP